MTITADTPITAEVIREMTFGQREALARYQAAKQEAFRRLTQKCRAANRAAQRAETDKAYAAAEARYVRANGEYADALHRARVAYEAAF